jgi:membrane associated rhomboid family serine protease
MTSPRKLAGSCRTVSRENLPVPVCYRHPSRETGVSCSNCGRPICPDCMTPTSVGMRCPECAGDRTKVRRMQGRGATASFARPTSPYDPRTWSITQILIVINVIVFLWEVAGGVSLGGGSVGGYAYIHGVLYGPFMSGNYHQYWRLLTSGFLHESIIHIGFNMLSLFFVGRSLEPAIGRLYFAVIYFTALLAGSFGALLFTPGLPTLGASGAIFGVFGALIMVARARRIPLWQSGLLPILLFNFIFTLTVAGVSIGGHLGGVLAGFATGWLVTEYGEKRDRRTIVLAGCLLIAVVSVVGGILVAGGSGLLPNGSTI